MSNFHNAETVKYNKWLCSLIEVKLIPLSQKCNKILLMHYIKNISGCNNVHELFLSLSGHMLEVFSVITFHHSSKL